MLNTRNRRLRWAMSIGVAAAITAGVNSPAQALDLRIKYPTYISVDSLAIHDLDDDYFTDAIDGQDAELYGDFVIKWGSQPGQEQAFRLGYCMERLSGQYRWNVSRESRGWGEEACNSKDVHSTSEPTDDPVRDGYHMADAYICNDGKHPWLTNRLPGPIAPGDADCGKGDRHHAVAPTLAAGDTVTIRYQLGDQDDWDSNDIICGGVLSFPAADIWRAGSAGWKSIIHKASSSNAPGCDVGFVGERRDFRPSPPPPPPPRV